MIEVIGGPLYQWDTGRIAVVRPEADQEILDVQFTTIEMESALRVDTYTVDGVIYCAIPNKILRQHRPIMAYEVTQTENGEKTVSKTEMPVNKRNKPEDYVYTEDEVFSYKKLEERLAAVEQIKAKENAVATAETLGVIKVGDNLTITEDGVLSVVTTNNVEQDNTHPITSAGVYAQVGNIEILLATL